MTLPNEERAQSTIDSQPDTITPRHRALMRRLVGGMRLTDACNDIGFSLTRASVIVNSPLFQAEMRTMEGELKGQFVEAEAEKSLDSTHTILSDASETAAKTLKGALNSENAQVAVSAAKDILDRTGYAKEDKIKANIIVEPSQSLIDVIGRIGTEKKKGKEEDE